MEGVGVIMYIVICIVSSEVPVMTLNITHRDSLIQSLFENYNAEIPPNYTDDSVLNIDVQIYILSIDSISDSTKDYSMSFFLRQRWYDSRLRYDKIRNVSSLQLDSKSIEKVWVPDLYILNEKKAIVHEVIVPNKLLHIRCDGTILYSIRISGTFSCDVDLLRFPLDSQVCPLIIESYGYSVENMRLRWYYEPVEKKEDIILSQFTLGGVDTFKCDKEYAGMNFSCVQMNVKLDRLYDYYIIQTYVPTILIVILSWVSFWISIDATPARISLGLLTVLTMTTQSTGLPKVSYFKAIDVWMVSCLCFVFAALIEFAWVNVLSRVHQRRQSMIDLVSNHRGMDGQDANRNEQVSSKKESKLNVFLQNMANREKARNVDKISRVLFPLSFLVFNIVYWTVYVYVVKSHRVC